MSDHEAIRRVLTDYCFGTDSGNIESWLACFTDDVVWEGGAFGRFEGKDAGRAYLGAAGDGVLNYRHINANHAIDVDGDRAVVRSYIVVLDQSGAAPSIMFSGFYDDVLVRSAGKWLIQSRKLVADPRELGTRVPDTASA